MNTLGNNLKLTLFGESHGVSVGATLDGFPAGFKVNEDYIKDCLRKRRPFRVGETTRIEEDEYEIISGVFNGYTTGEPITIVIKNLNPHSSDYDNTFPRPSHADYMVREASKGYNDFRGGGHRSGRLTAPIVALGALCISYLESKGIIVSSHMYSVGELVDKPFDTLNPSRQIELVNLKGTPTISLTEEEIDNEIDKYREMGDSIGGSVEVCVTGLPVGVGSPWFEALDAQIAASMLSIPGVKGIEFGLGFNYSKATGSTANDQYGIRDSKVVVTSNNSGGITGGYSTGAPLIYRLAVKPTPSIALPQISIDYETMTEKEIVISGRHDSCLVRRITIVSRALTALTILDALLDYNKRR